MKKFTGRYTTNTAKALKGSERILCQVSEDGTIYICNGFLLCTMNAPEYAATVQPLTCCEPGAWTFDKDGKHEDEAHKLDLVKLFADTVRDTADALHEVTEAANVTTHLRALGVECKPIFTPDDCHVNFIAVFSLGNTTAQRINEIARKADLCVLFQCPTH